VEETEYNLAANSIRSTLIETAGVMATTRWHPIRSWWISATILVDFQPLQFPTGSGNRFILGMDGPQVVLDSPSVDLAIVRRPWRKGGGVLKSCHRAAQPVGFNVLNLLCWFPQSTTLYCPHASLT
jgi:hypothetical protein